MGKKKIEIFTEFDTVSQKWIGKCRQFAGVYEMKDTRDSAYSAARRSAQRLAKMGFAPITQTLSKTPPTPAKRKVNRIAFVVDRSGSMGSIMQRAIQALESNIETIRQKTKETGQEAEITVIAFDTDITKVLDGALVRSFSHVPTKDLFARGSTALFDAVSKAIFDLERTPAAQDEDVSYLVMTITDGEENASRTTASELNNLMKRVQATDRWTLTFLLPPYSKSRFCSGFNIPDGNVMEWEATTRGVQQYQAQNSAGIGSYFAARSTGLNSLKSFYTDLSGLTQKQVKTQLDDLSKNIRVLSVDKEQDIKSFVEDTLGTYVPGSAFYQLTKDEKKIQGYKSLLVMEKGKRQVYGGDDARQVLGIPDGDLKVRPGNHANWDIFVQSTSLNRKLVRGTKLLVDTTVNVPVVSPYKSSAAQPRARRKY